MLIEHAKDINSLSMYPFRMILSVFLASPPLALFSIRAEIGLKAGAGFSGEFQMPYWLKLRGKGLQEPT